MVQLILASGTRSSVPERNFVLTDGAFKAALSILPSNVSDHMTPVKEFAAERRN
jgi:hypothetical protein